MTPIAIPNLDAPAAAIGARPSAKGWCPGAHRPMASGDGLLVRVRPRLSRLTTEQVLGLCELAQGLGSGLIDLTHRANLQMRGVQPRDHAAVVDGLCRLGLLDADPQRETWPAILVAPGWEPDDDTERIATELAARLGELPALPAKFGFAVDAGAAPVLGAASADVRIERGQSGGLIVRADGAAAGKPVTRAQAVEAALAMATWFAATAGATPWTSRRMRPHLATHSPPRAWEPLEPPAASAALPAPGVWPLGPVYGVAFGQIEAAALARLLRDCSAVALRLAPQRMLLLEGGVWRDSREFVTVAHDAMLHTEACPGAPACASATVATRAIARALASASGPQRTLHVSGCAKGCAWPRAADITVVGRDGVFDLVRNGCAWDTPAQTGLSPEGLRAILGVL